MIVINVRASVPAGGSPDPARCRCQRGTAQRTRFGPARPWLAYEDPNLTTLDSRAVWMVRRELSRILDDDDPFLLRHQRAARQAGSFLPEPVPPLIRNASLASIMRDKSSAVPGVSELEATQSSSEKLNEAQGNCVRPGFRAAEWL